MIPRYRDLWRFRAPLSASEIRRTARWLATAAVALSLLLRSRPQSTTAFRLVVHAADIVWPVLISMFATAQRGPFFLFFVLVMAAGAYRWGLWERVGTAATAV